MSDENFQLPPSYIEPENIETWILDIFDSPFGLPCVCGDQTEGRDLHIVRPHIIRICQREDNPCFVEIDFHLGTAEGIYTYQPSRSGYSFDTTNGADGTWHELRPDLTHAAHNPSLNDAALKSSNKVNANWAFGLFDPNNSAHITNDPCVPNWHTLGIPVHKFVFDMCGHVSTWMKEPKVSFRLTFDKPGVDSHRPISCGVTFTND